VWFFTPLITLAFTRIVGSFMVTPVITAGCRELRTQAWTLHQLLPKRAVK